MNHLSIFISDLRFIFLRRRGIEKPFRILCINLRLKATQKLLEIFKIKRTRENILGMVVTFPDYGGFCHLWREIFIREYYYFKSDAASPSIMDVGSNIGMSICYFKALYPSAKIIGFEPDPSAFIWLKKNIELNKFSDITLHNVALTAKTGDMKFYQDADREASGINSIKPNTTTGPKNAIKVKSAKPSAFITGTVDLLKIDAEGAEYEILEEAKSKLNLVKNIFLEIHQTDGCVNEPLHSVLKILDDCNFRYAITEAFVSHHEFIEKPSRPYAALIDASRCVRG